MTGDGIRVIETEAPSGKVEELAQKARSEILAGQDDWRLSSNSTLLTIRDLFIRPAAQYLRSLKEVRFITFGPLQEIPPTLLLAPDAAPKRISWLTDQVKLSVIPGLAHTAAQPSDDGGRSPKVGSLVIYADPEFAGNLPACLSAMQSSALDDNGNVEFSEVRNYCRIPKTLDVANGVLKALSMGSLKEPAQQATVRTGENASEGSFQNDAQSGRLAAADVIVLATHGLTAAETQAAIGINEPSLVFTPPAKSLGSPGGLDGFLTTSEIVKLHLNAKWVVLTACNSAKGDGINGSEALSGLAKAFMEAGAKGVIVSYWPVDASSSAYLVGSLMKAWHSGEGRMPDALQEVIYDMKTPPFNYMKQAQFVEPIHWGPFVIVSRQ